MIESTAAVSVTIQCRTLQEGNRNLFEGIDVINMSPLSSHVHRVQTSTSGVLYSNVQMLHFLYLSVIPSTIVMPPAVRSILSLIRA